ncbi:hypothetical protein OSB04_017044 [Centaurea solstitialis]|uniref:OTU domain-containing protein n=1 Tax=Centaurea solstitialis TaxID=347529 RepID=A0AA38T3T7_9ASTR|nr:hypothetical protein OSB04_017044 [Centaurea solstitialis]
MEDYWIQIMDYLVEYDIYTNQTTHGDDFHFYQNFNDEEYDIHTNQTTQCDNMHFYRNSNDEECNINLNRTTQGDDIHASKFSTDETFKSRQDLIDWVQRLGRSLGYIIVIKRSKTTRKGIMSKVVLICDRGGKYRGNGSSCRHTGTKKINCPFKLAGKYLSMHDCWTVRVICDKHNHEAAEDMEGHPYAMRLTENELRLVEDLSRKNVKPRDILSTLKEQNPDNVSTLRTIYNARRRFWATEHKGRTQMQVVMSFFQEEGYMHEARTNQSNELEDLFFIHPISMEMWRAFPHILLMDATYKTNTYRMPLLEIVGVTSTNMTFCIAFVFMHKENENNYTWALNCLKKTMEGCASPRVIVTDRELALMKACNNVFPDAKQLLCRWHINQSIFKKCRPTITSHHSWNSFYKAWTSLVESQTEETYKLNLTQVEATLLKYPGVLDYLNKVWLKPYKQMFVSVWTDRFLNFGNHTTNRVESQHSKLKLYLNSTQSNLREFLSDVHQLIHSQHTSIKASFQQSKTVFKHRYKTPHFRQLCGFVSLHALELIFKEFGRSKNLGLVSGCCGCQMRTCYGLPCVHEQTSYFNAGQSIPLESIDGFWRKLDLSPCISVEDGDICCDDDVQMFTENFKKQPRSMKSNFLRKLREIFVPWTTRICEPAVHTTTRGRPSLKSKVVKKSRVDPPYQEPHRHSCPDASSFMEFDVLANNEQARHSSYFHQNNYAHPYINQFPSILHPYIMQIHDVKGDGNCGFRAIAVCLGRHEDEWPSIRYDLMEELNMYKTEYLEVYGIEVWHQLYNSLNFFELDIFAPNEHWMDVFETGLLIASRYNVILHSLTTVGSMTFFPLRSSPPPWYEHVAFTIGYVNGNHYVKISMADGHPMPSIVPNWFRFKYDCATAWATPYMTRVNKFEQLLSRNRTSNRPTDFISVDELSYKIPHQLASYPVQT